MISYEAPGIFSEGGAQKFIAVGDNSNGGVRDEPARGVAFKGSPLGATGLAQCYELTHQVRGAAEPRQVQGARLALQHNPGLGGACVVTLYQTGLRDGWMKQNSIPLESPFVSVSDQVALHARNRAECIALVDGDEVLSWRELSYRADQLSSWLVRAGVKPGDRICVLPECEAAVLAAIIGIWRARAVFVPLSPMLTQKMLADMISDCGATVLIASDRYKDVTFALAEGKKYTVQILGTENLPDVDRQAPNLFCNKPSDLASIIYSSGTTGSPKGIAHTHQARLAFATVISVHTRMGPQSCAHLVIPPHSNGAMLMWGPAMLVGAKIILQRTFDVDGLFAIIEKWRPTHGFLVPVMCEAIIRQRDVGRARLESFECVITAGSPMRASVKKDMQRLTDNALAELWGLTEGLATFLPPEEMARRTDSVGRPIIGCDLRIVDESGQDISRRGVGEIAGTSDGLMAGYWNAPAKTREMVWSGGAGADYIRSGDVGEIDDDGFLYLRGRSKDMIISGGINIYPADIEKELLAHGAVSDAVVVGIEHAKWGETPVGFILPHPGLGAIETEGLLEWVNQKLARYQRLSDLRVWEGDFPRNTLGKVVKSDLVKSYLRGGRS